MTIRDRETNETITIDDNTSVSDLSRARQIIDMQIKELDKRKKKIDSLLQPIVEQAYKSGEKMFENYWTIVGGAARFNKSFFKKEADPTTYQDWEDLDAKKKAIEEDYKVEGKPYLKHPKL